jgi:hypothetical protein
MVYVSYTTGETSTAVVQGISFLSVDSFKYSIGTVRAVEVELWKEAHGCIASQPRYTLYFNQDYRTAVIKE